MSNQRRVATLVVLWASLFLLGLSFRSVIFLRPHPENDERIYRALVDQLERGEGYTLQGHEILRETWIVREQYEHPLFFHPPGGIALFWLMRQLFGTIGDPASQILSYALFYWGMAALAAQIFGRSALLPHAIVAILSAFTPIMTHVVSRFWLDGPLLGFSTLAAAAFVTAAKKESTAWACLAGAVLGYASLIKVTALLAAPGIVVLAWVLAGGARGTKLGRRIAVFVSIALLIQLPWEIWQMRVVGSFFPYWAGKPAAILVATNRYVHYLTVIRSPWIYVTLLPKVVWTLAPSALLFALQWKDRDVRRKGLALWAWIVAVVAAHVVLGAIGYSKLLRYVILITPATVLLFAVCITAAWSRLKAGAPLLGSRAFTWAVLGLAGVGIALEVFQGVKTPLYDNRDIIHPWWYLL
jgi:4-amino-4-deoxy-L-arabinose transferase-like glycosyltransferase